MLLEKFSNVLALIPWFSKKVHRPETLNVLKSSIARANLVHTKRGQELTAHLTPSLLRMNLSLAS